MAKEKSHIIVTLQGKPIGYVKSISYKCGTFKMSNYKQNAKGYATFDRIRDDIDFLTKFNSDKGYVFIYN